MAGITKVITDQHEILEAIGQFQAGTKKIWCACVESSLPRFSVGKVKQGYLAAAKRGVKIMYITEMTKDNIAYCEEIMGFAELRHLDAVKGNFALSETEYIAGVMEGAVMVNLVVTDVAEIVHQQRLLFQTLWAHAEPAANRISRLTS